MSRKDQCTHVLIPNQGIYIYYYFLQVDKSLHMSGPSQPFPKLSFDAQTEDSQIKAPKHKPMESEEIPPELKLEDSELHMELQSKLFIGEGQKMTIIRRRSLDMNYSILGFITRKIRQKTRQRIMSEELNLKP